MPSAATFCPDCGAAIQTIEPADAAASTLDLRLFIDTQALRHFLAGTRCALRLRVSASEPLREVAVHAQLSDGERLAPARREPAGEPGPRDLGEDPGAPLTLWLLPQLAGFYELRGLLCAVGQRGGQRGYARFDGLQFRVGAPGEGPRVAVVNIDQRSARVVDNSRSTFQPSDGPERGGLVHGGDWHEVPLTAVPHDAAAALFPEAVPAPQPPPVPPAPRPAPGGPVRFTVKAERDSYDVIGVLAQGDLATIYDGRRLSDGARVAVKLAEDEADNDLMANEVAALRLLTAEDSPQRKHLPVVLDRFHTRDHRLGTIFAHLDGHDLVEVRRRLPDGLPARHLIWLMRRCLSVLGWAHSRGVLHGNVDPQHIMLRARDHNVWLLDWCYAIVNPAQTGKGFACLNEIYSPPEVAARQPPLPSSDLYALGKSMFFVLGGDPQRKALPPDLDERLQRFLQYFVLESPLSRAGDAWEAYRQLDRLRADLFGPHQFVELHL